MANSECPEEFEFRIASEECGTATFVSRDVTLELEYRSPFALRNTAFPITPAA